ncbi:MAG: hypothetical protein NTY66_00890 [Candidatus Vogelbacteria bacterium]|nr:hypothetical protein [Candidatus Vogelbacteria bacterium]
MPNLRWSDLSGAHSPNGATGDPPTQITPQPKCQSNPTRGKNHPDDFTQHGDEVRAEPELSAEEKADEQWAREMGQYM